MKLITKLISMGLSILLCVLLASWMRDCERNDSPAEVETITIHGPPAAPSEVAHTTEL